MNASKEQATEALERITNLMNNARGEGVGKDLQFLREFTEAAKRKLPSEAAYAKERSKKYKN